MSKFKTEVFAHYDRLLGCRSKGELLEEGYDVDSCTLCREYYCGDRTEGDCLGCPVALKTGQQFCYGSPWHQMDAVIRSMPDNDVLLQEPLPEVVAMRLFLDGLDWSNQP